MSANFNHTTAPAIVREKGAWVMLYSRLEGGPWLLICGDLTEEQQGPFARAWVPWTASISIKRARKRFGMRTFKMTIAPDYTPSVLPAPITPRVPA